MKLRKQKQNKTNKSTNTTKRINNTINTNDAIYGSIIGVNCDVDSLCCVGAFVGFVLFLLVIVLESILLDYWQVFFSYFGAMNGLF